MGSNILTNCSCAENLIKKKQALPIETIFHLPAETPVWPPGVGFASGVESLIWVSYKCLKSQHSKKFGPSIKVDQTIKMLVFEPIGIPPGFFVLGSYCQPNNKPLFGWVLVEKYVSSSPINGTLKQPVDYTLVWSSAFQKINQDSPGYVWLPKAPNCYKAVGHVVTTTPDKPALDKIRSVKSDLTDQCETYSWIWGPGKDSDHSIFNVYDARPSNRGTLASGVRVGTFVAQNCKTCHSLSIACLKNNKANSTSMPNLLQIEALVQAYSPFMYLHPDEEYPTSSINWSFSNGALLYKKGEESKPIPTAPNGTNLPQGGINDGAYWLDLPADEPNKERVKKGDLLSSKSYIHVKPMLGGTSLTLPCGSSTHSMVLQEQK